MNTKSIFAGVLVALAVQPALASERYGFRCMVSDRTVTHYPPASGLADKVVDSTFQKVRVFLVDPDKKVWRERFLGSDGPATPFTIKTVDAGAVMNMDGEKAPMHIWLSGKWSGAFFDLFDEKDDDGNKVSHILDGTCEEVADIPDVDLPAKSFADRAKKSLNDLIGAK